MARSVPVLGAFVVGAIAYAPLYCYPFLAPEFELTFGASRALSQMPWTAFLLVSALSSPLLGRAYDLVSDRLLLLVGTALIAAGWCLASLATNMSMLICAYGVLLALGLQTVFVGVSTAIARRYPGAAGLALGVAYAGPGIGVALALPLAEGIIPDLGWRQALVAFGVLSLAAVPFVLLMTTGSEVMVPVKAGPGALGAVTEPAPSGVRPDPGALRRILRTRRFLILLVGAVGIGCIDEGVFQMSPRHGIEQGIDPGFAAALLALQCYAYVAGQVVGGGLSDRFGRRFVGLLCAAMMAAGATAIFFANGSTPALALAGNFVYGFGIGATIAIRSATFSDVFGGANFGAIFGIVAIAYPIGGIVVMSSGGIGHDMIGTYWPVYGVVMVSILAWSTALLAAGPRRHGLRRRLAGVRSLLPR